MVQLRIQQNVTTGPRIWKGLSEVFQTYALHSSHGIAEAHSVSPHHHQMRNDNVLQVTASDASVTVSAWETFAETVHWIFTWGVLSYLFSLSHKDIFK